MHLATFAGCLLSISIASSAAGTDYFPFNDGVTYEYVRIPESLGRYTAYFSGTADVDATTTHVRRFDDGLQQFWSETPEGDKSLHGIAFRLEAPLLFSPPILTIDEPIYVGKVWLVDSVDSDNFAFHVRYEVTAFGGIAVPAGTYPAFTIRETVEFPLGGAPDKIARHLRGTRGFSGTAQQVTDWSYADGIGQIRIVVGSRTDQLLSFSTVRVEPSTWTRIRLLFR